MKPTAHFLQHHDVEPPRIDATNFRRAWRVRPRLDRLLIDRVISPAEWWCAVQMRIHVEQIASAGLHATPTNYVTGQKRTFEQSYAQAAAHLRRIAESIGDPFYPMLVACIVEDLSWPALGERLNIDARTARAWVVVAIKLLAKI